MSHRSLWIFPLFFLSLLIWGCSSGVPCSGTVCGSGEVCESGKCVLGLSFDGSDPMELCDHDADCTDDKICTLASSKPPSTCIPQLDCDLDGDCQSGLTCASDGICR